MAKLHDIKVFMSLIAGNLKLIPAKCSPSDYYNMM